MMSITPISPNNVACFIRVNLVINRHATKIGIKNSKAKNHDGLSETKNFTDAVLKLVD